VEGFVDKLVQYNMGETCYMKNSSLHQLLKQLGFHSRYTCLKGHLALLVRLPNEKEEVYVDCGNGAPFFNPVRFTTDPDNVSEFGGIEVRFRAESEAGQYTYYRYVDGKLMTDIVWPFDINKTYQFADFQPAINNYFQPNSLFMSSLRCQLWQLDRKRSLSLVNNMLSIRYSDRKVEKHILRDHHDIREVINHEFNLPKLPVEDAMMVIEELGVDLF
jgi:N-hydroxyarylamine O-acetyltransferase